MKKILSILVLLLLASVMLTSCGLTVPRPEIKEGRFDFSITYELNGETKTISGVYVCEYDGTGWVLDGGYHREWKDRVEGDNVGDGNSVQIGTTDDGGAILLSFGFYPQYFMGESGYGGMDAPAPSLAISYPENEFGEMTVVNEPEDLEQTYGVRIVSYDYAQPLENTFGLFK